MNEVRPATKNGLWPTNRLIEITCCVVLGHFPEIVSSDTSQKNRLLIYKRMDSRGAFISRCKLLFVFSNGSKLLFVLTNERKVCVLNLHSQFRFVFSILQ